MKRRCCKGCFCLKAVMKCQQIFLRPWREKVAEGRMRGYPAGFTLIELLVVVLIIDILAAVAVPQYKKAVFKARFTQVQTAFNAYMKAIDVYVLENGYPNTRVGVGDKLDVEMHGDRSYDANSTSFGFGHFGVACQADFCAIGFKDTRIVENGKFVDNPSPWMHGLINVSKHADTGEWFLMDATDIANSDNLKAICQWWASTHGVEYMEEEIQAKCVEVGVE